MADDWRFEVNEANNSWELWKGDEKCGETIWTPLLLIRKGAPVSNAESMYFERLLRQEYHEKNKGRKFGALAVPFDITIDAALLEKMVKAIYEVLEGDEWKSAISSA